MIKAKIKIIGLIVLVAIAGLIYYKNSGSTIKRELSDFAIKDTATITKIFMADQGGRSVLLERKSATHWKVNDRYKARQDGIQNLLTTINRVTVMSPISKNAYENIIKQIVSSSTKVELYVNNKSKPEKVFYVGGSSQNHTGTYMLMDGSSVPFLCHMEGFYGFLTPRFFVSENEWRDREIFRYEYGEIAQIKVEHPQDENASFQINEVGQNLFELKSIKTGEIINHYDTLRLLEYITYFKNIQYESFEETKDEIYKQGIIEKTPLQIYSVTDKLGRTKKIATYLKPIAEGATDIEGVPIDFDIDRLYGYIDDTDFVIIQYFVFDKLEKSLRDFKK
jgi:hypothetical protein